VRNRWVLAIQWLVGLAVVYFAGRSLLSNWDQLGAQPLSLRLQPGWFLLSLLTVWLMYALLIAAWRRMLIGWGHSLDWKTAARIWTVSALGKYLPGKVWAVAGMAVMSQRAGVTPWAATSSAVVLQVLAIGTGAALAGLTGMGALETAHPGARGALLLLVTGAVGCVGLLLWPPFLKRLLRLVTPGTTVNDVPAAGGIVFGIGANLVAWSGYGLALWFLAQSLVPEPILSLRLATAAFAASYLVGFLALFAPGGIGVREGMFILMLKGPLGIGAATALAVGSRVLLTITELGAAAPFLVHFKRNARVAP